MARVAQNVFVSECACACVRVHASSLMNGCRVEPEAWRGNLLIMNETLLSCMWTTHSVECVFVCLAVCMCAESRGARPIAADLPWNTPGVLCFTRKHGNFFFLLQLMQIVAVVLFKKIKKEHLQTRHTICSFCVLLIFFSSNILKTILKLCRSVIQTKK